MIDFHLPLLSQHELFNIKDDYTPLIISLNYKENAKKYAFISYFIFIKDSSNTISGVKNIKQIIIIDGITY
jgi:hypothetical protein